MHDSCVTCGAIRRHGLHAGWPVIDAGRLLADLTRLRADLEDDLRERCEDDPELDAFLQGEHRRATTRERTAETYDFWREEHLMQVAVAWILGCVFVRFLEDSTLVDPPRLSGPGDRRRRALDEHNLYFRAHPTDTDASTAARLPHGGGAAGRRAALRRTAQSALAARPGLSRSFRDAAKG